MTRYLSLGECLWLAEQVTGTEATVLAKAARLDLADSALHAPAAGFGDDDFYPDLIDKAAVLTCRLAWNHPLPDGNKRAAWACLVMFLDLNDCSCRTRRAQRRRGRGGHAGRGCARGRRRLVRGLAARSRASRPSPAVALPAYLRVAVAEQERRTDDQRVIVRIAESRLR